MYEVMWKGACGKRNVHGYESWNSHCVDSLVFKGQVFPSSFLGNFTYLVCFGVFVCLFPNSHSVLNDCSQRVDSRFTRTLIILDVILSLLRFCLLASDLELEGPLTSFIHKTFSSMCNTLHLLNRWVPSVPLDWMLLESFSNDEFQSVWFLIYEIT